MKVVEQLLTLGGKSQEWSPEHKADNLECCLSVVAEAS